MKSNTFLKRTLMSLMAFTMLITAMIGFGATKASASTTVKQITDGTATAYINDDGSGCIYLNRVYTQDDRLTEINGVPLKDIIKFKDGGYISEFYYKHPDQPFFGYAECVYVWGQGPSGLFNGSGYLHFMDKTGDVYNMSIWSSFFNLHYISYNSEHPEIVKISWDS